MRLTLFGAKGLAFYIAMLGAFFAAPYSNLFFLLLAFLTLQWATCAVSTWRNLRGVEVSVADFEPLAAGQSTSATALARAERRTRFQVELELRFKGSAAPATGRLEVLRGTAAFDVTLPALARGVYRVERASLSSRYPLGLLRARVNAAAPDELVVYPAPADLDASQGTGEVLRELLRPDPNRSGDLQPASLRDHRDGDDPRSIHWRASARRGQLVVQEWEGASGQGIEIVLDRRCSEEQLEVTLSMLSAIALHTKATKELLTLTSQDFQATFGEGQRPYAEALRFLAEAQTLPMNAPAPPPVSPGVTRLPRSSGHA